jgi:hypothetical protein
MPPLLRGVARTAVVAGTATAASGRVQRRHPRPLLPHQPSRTRSSSSNGSAHSRSRGCSTTTSSPPRRPGSSTSDDGQLQVAGEETRP